jgi:hypothetical protein
LDEAPGVVGLKGAGEQLAQLAVLAAQQLYGGAGFGAALAIAVVGAVFERRLVDARQRARRRRGGA